MDKQEYLTTLEKALKGAGVADCADILEEYAEHFDMKAADGYGEEEVAARLVSPENVASQYIEIGFKSGEKGGFPTTRIVTSVGLVFCGIFAFGFFIMLFSMMIAAGSIEPWHVWQWFK